MSVGAFALLLQCRGKEGGPLPLPRIFQLRLEAANGPLLSFRPARSSGSLRRLS